MHGNHVGVGASAAAAALPVFAYLVFIYRLDRYEREPIWLVFLTFLYGAVGAIILGVLLSLTVMATAHVSDMQIAAGVVAPLCEEPSKALIVFLLLLSRYFDNTTDGLIYGAAAGLGFGMTENFLYFMQADQVGDADHWQKVVILRSAFSCLMHCASTATFGAICGRFRYRGAVQQWLLAPLLGLLIAMTIHSVFNNVLVYADGHDESLAIIAFGLIPVMAILLFTVTMISLGREHRMLAAELREEAAQGLLPPEHAEILPFHRKRWRAGWLDPRVQKKRYIEAATLLAFRKWQSKLPTGRRPEIHQDIVRLRGEVGWLLGRLPPPGYYPPQGMPPGQMPPQQPPPGYYPPA